MPMAEVELLDENLRSNVPLGLTKRRQYKLLCFVLL